jgi:chromosome segregation protein
MYVRSLRLAGFKSFADPTVLDFEAGVNVIVGPNGSGKSNISDALSWVLGSQAPSTLRGASMEDVIFAGAAGRPALGMAEVELTLDNTNRVLPLDLNEVTISRFADRSGASEYRINGATCRLLDIQELLSDTGIGRSIHTVVSQGQLDAVLQARPEDRRSFIEEAAQIGKYRRRKDRSLRKIERVDENLTRLNDVLTELRRSIRPLKRQASAAEAFTELMEEHRDLRQRLTAHDIRNLRHADVTGDPEAETQRRSLLSEELSSTRARLETVAAERERLAEAAEGARATAHRIARAADRLTGLGKLATERAATISARLAAETEEGYRERIRLLEEDHSRWSSELTELRSTAGSLRHRADGTRAEVDRSRSELDEAERELAARRGAETTAAQALVRAEGSEAAGRATLGSIGSRIQAVTERREMRERELAQDVATVQRAETEIQTLETELDGVAEAAAAAEGRLEEARERADGLRERLGLSHAEAMATAARLEALEEVRTLLNDVHGVSDRIEPLIQDAHERVRLAGAGEEEARSILATADADVETRWAEVAKLDEELRRLDALMSGAAERLGGFRRQREAHEVELAALDEEISRTRDALAAAEREASEVRASLPEHQAALDEARSHRENAEHRLSDVRDRLAIVSARVRDEELEARGAEERVLAANLRVEEAATGITEARAALEGLADLRSSLEGSRDRAEAVAEAATFAARTAESWAAEAEERAVLARDRAVAGEQSLHDLRARERELADSLEEVVRRLGEAEVRRAEARTRIESLAERAMEEWGLSIDVLDQLPAIPTEEVDGARSRVEVLDRQMRRMGVINPRAAEEYTELAERETFLVDQMDDLRSSRRDLMKVVEEVDATIVEVFSQAFEDVAREFEGVFGRLFPGGAGRLKLTNPDDVLHSGIEVEARPPGKNVKKLSLLSGGERSLVALAFLFAIFRSRPSPFYLLDEVEAALDDFNLQRFISLVDELEERAQILIVTHQKRTMESADIIYGVSMAKDGVSRVIAKRMEEAVSEATRANATAS